MFDAAAFANTVYDQPNDTQSIQVPEGEYNAMVSKFEPREIQQKDGKKQVVLDVYWEIDDAGGAVATATGRDKNTVRQTLWLDTTPQGALDMGKGKNPQLGRLRESVGQNKPGPWNFNRLVGCPAKVLVVHAMSADGKIFANVKSVAAL